MFTHQFFVFVWQTQVLFDYSYYSGVALEREVEGDLVLGDLGDGLPFRAGAFDGAISISALQWLCNADKKYHKPHKRLFAFFSSLYACLVSIILAMAGQMMHVSVRF